jgi:cytochrome b561
VLFGVLPLPDFVGKDAALADLLKPWHGWLAWMLVAVVSLHVMGALKHHFVDRDDLIRRMTWGRTDSSTGNP